MASSSGFVNVVANDFRKAYFSETTYKAGRVPKGLALHYLIALGQPQVIIEKWIEGRRQKKPEHLNAQEQRYNLTPLAVCVLAKNVGIARALLNAGVDPHIPDFMGWTPLHHAAVLGYHELTGIFVAALGGEEAALKLKSLQGSTYQDLQSFVSTANAAGPIKGCFIKEAGTVVQCTAEKFYAIAKARFCNGVLMTSDHLLSWWQAQTPQSLASYHDKQFTTALLKSYAKMQANPPKLVLRHDEGAVGWGVAAGELIKKFQALCIYGGKLIVTQEESDAIDRGDFHRRDYVFDQVDGQKYRNYGGMFNDSYPNVVLHVLDQEGYKRDMMVSSEDIPAGQQLFLDYGFAHGVKKNYVHKELNLDGLHKFALSKHSRLLDFLSQKTLNLLEVMSDIDFFAEYVGLQYILNTPSSMIYLVGIGQLPIELLNAFCKREDLQLNKTSVQIASYAISIANNLSEHEKQLGSAAEDIQVTLKRWADTLPLIKFMFFLSDLAKITTISEWDALKGRLP